MTSDPKLWFIPVWVTAFDEDAAEAELSEAAAGCVAGCDWFSWVSGEDEDWEEASEEGDGRCRYEAFVAVLADQVAVSSVAGALHDRGAVLRGDAESQPLPLGTVAAAAAVKRDLSVSISLEAAGAFGSDDYERPDGFPARLVARVGSEIAGRAELYVQSGGVARVHYLEVEEPFQRLGVGSALLDAVENLCPGGWHTNDFTDDGDALMGARG